MEANNIMTNEIAENVVDTATTNKNGIKGLAVSFAIGLATGVAGTIGTKLLGSKIKGRKKKQKTITIHAVDDEYDEEAEEADE